MGYANSVGDFGGLTSYDAHFFFLLSFFLLYAILSPTLINSLDYSKAFSYNQHKEAKKPVSVDIAKVKLLRRASFFYTHFGYFHGNGLSSKNSFLSYPIHFPIFGRFHALDEFCKVQLKVFAYFKAIQFGVFLDTVKVFKPTVWIVILETVCECSSDRRCKKKYCKSHCHDEND